MINKAYRNKETYQYKKLKSEYSKRIKSLLDENECLSPYFITVRPKFIPINSLSLDTTQKSNPFFTDATWKQYSRLYRHLISNLTNNFQKKRYLYPQTFDFFDVDNSRETKNAPFSNTTIPHIHSIYLIHHDTADRFTDLMNDNFQTIINHPSIKPYFASLNAEPITDDIDRVVSYCSKFYDNSYAKSIRNYFPLFNQFPPPANELRSSLSKEEKEDLKKLYKQKVEFKFPTNQ